MPARSFSATQSQNRLVAHGDNPSLLSWPDNLIDAGAAGVDRHRSRGIRVGCSCPRHDAGAGIETALGFWGGYRVTGGVKGFWTNVDDNDRQTCRRADCIIVDPTGEAFDFGPPDLVNRTSRDVDYWGGAAEFKFGRPAPVYEKPNFYRNDYFIVGADVRGIDQDIKIHGKFDGDPIFAYKETLDTTYYGGYIGIGGEYSFGFMPFIGSAVKGVGGIYDRLGLRTFINARAGLYQADTDYDGRFAFDFFDFNSKISKSNDDLAFIGTISLERRKQLGARTSLSLLVRL